MKAAAKGYRLKKILTGSSPGIAIDAPALSSKTVFCDLIWRWWEVLGTTSARTGAFLKLLLNSSLLLIPIPLYIGENEYELKIWADNKRKVRIVIWCWIYEGTLFFVIPIDSNIRYTLTNEVGILRFHTTQESFTWCRVPLRTPKFVLDFANIILEGSIGVILVRLAKNCPPLKLDQDGRQTE